eukprot:GFYU01006594.1.p1 GENE.GFYU01006594.1~~GFYU01006594.1.p1  ORF type:complete len:145 (-),score=25.00 GFYU01006594.1:358-762(-)
MCSGTDGEFSIEDTACAGALVAAMGGPDNSIELNDLGWAAWYLHEAHSNETEHLLKQSRHGKRLIEQDLGTDVEFCSQQDMFNIVPVFRDHTIRQEAFLSRQLSFSMEDDDNDSTAQGSICSDSGLMRYQANLE